MYVTVQDAKAYFQNGSAVYSSFVTLNAKVVAYYITRTSM
jgi:hypothetical protein